MPELDDMSSWIALVAPAGTPRAIVDRLQVGIASGGASIDRYRDTMGKPGTMQDMLLVHRHEGDPCPRCGTTIVKTRVAQRGTYHCPQCQPAS